MNLAANSSFYLRRLNRISQNSSYSNRNSGMSMLANSNDIYNQQPQAYLIGGYAASVNKIMGLNRRSVEAHSLFSSNDEMGCKE